MKVYCLPEFKDEYRKLVRKKQYAYLTNELISLFFSEKTIEDLKSGTRLNGSSEYPYIKKRLGGRGGFRLYYYLLVKNDSAYLMFIHPKTGNLGATNIDDKSKAHLFKKVVKGIIDNDILLVNHISESNEIEFSVVAPKDDL